jgi:MFS family permease
LFTASTVSAVLNYICVASISFLMPFYLIQGRGFEAAHAGLLLAAQPLVMAIAAPLSGTASDRVGSRLPATAGMLILALGLFLLASLGATAPPARIVLALATAGLGTGIFISPNNSALMGAAPGNRQGIAAGMLATARNVGMVLGVGLAGAILTTMLAQSPEAASSPALIAAIRYALLTAAGVALAGTLVSALREG